MTAAPAIENGIERAERALLDIVESDRSRVCERILGEARGRADALRAQAYAAARARMREVFDEQRRRRRERIAAAQARLATARRVHEQQRVAAWLKAASEELPLELLALWRRDDARAAWARGVLAAARERLPAGRWHIAHAPDWRHDERDRITREVAGDSAPRCEPEADIAAGLRVACGGIVLDGTLEGLLSDRADVEARLLQHREAPA